MQGTASINNYSSTTPTNGNGRIPFAKLLDQHEFPKPQRGDIMQGEILRIDEDVLFIDVGAKRDAMVPFEEVSQLDDDFLDNLTRGDEVPVYVTRTPFGDDQLLVSLERGLQKLDWDRAQKLQGENEIVELPAINYNKGGIVVQFGRIQGFVPNSHIPAIRNQYDQRLRQQHKAKQIGETCALKIIEVDAQRDRLVLSATAVQKEVRQKRLRTLEHGQIVTGNVVNVKKYGAFVDIGDGLTGLLHISKIDWQHLDHPGEILAVGDEVEVMVDEVDAERERISLNRKVLLPDPWKLFVEAHETGELIEGKVSSIVDFGAFIKLPEGIEGLLHKNEIDMPTDSEVSDVLEIGDLVLLRINNIDQSRHRLSLSMRRVSAAEEILWMSEKHNGKQEIEA